MFARVMSIAKFVVVILAVIILGHVGWYVTDTEGFLDVYSRNPYLWAGITVAGLAAFAYMALRVLATKREAWYALLEAATIAGAIASFVISRQGNSAWQLPGIGAVLVTVVCFVLLFFDPRRGSASDGVGGGSKHTHDWEGYAG